MTAALQRPEPPRAALSAAEAAALRQHFPSIIQKHLDKVLRLLHPLDRAIAIDLAQACFVQLFERIVASGYPENIAACLRELAADALDGFRRGRAPLSDGERAAFVTAVVDALPTAPSETQPDLSLEQYASLCAEVAVAGARRVAIGLRYGVPSARAHDELDARWRDRLLADPALAQRFRERLNQYVGLLSTLPT